MKPDIQCVRTHWIRGFMAFPGGPGSAGGAAAVEEGGEGGEDRQERDGPQQRGGYRVLHGPGRDGRRGIGVAPQVAGGGGDRADRVPVGDEPQDRGHVLGGDQPVGDDGKGKEDDQADALRRFGGLAHDAEAAAAPGQGVAEEQEQREPADDRADAGVGPPLDDEAGDGDDQGAQGGGRQVSQGSPDQYGGSPHGQGPEAVDDAAVEVGARQDSGVRCRGGEVQREQTGDGEVIVRTTTGPDDPGD